MHSLELKYTNFDEKLKVSKPMMFSIVTQIYVTRPQSVYICLVAQHFDKFLDNIAAQALVEFACYFW